VGARLLRFVLARVERTGSGELFTLAVAAIALGVAYGAAELFGASFALGAFIAGMQNQSRIPNPASLDLRSSKPGRSVARRHGQAVTSDRS
jgi:CPA2 family monovalent cation:H+ antiporter-2